MRYIKIFKKDGKVWIQNEKGRVSVWGPAKIHKGTNIFKLASELLGVSPSITIETKHDTNYIVSQPDMFLKRKLREK